MLVKTAVKLFKSRISVRDSSNRHCRHICFEVYFLSETKERDELGTNWLVGKQSNSNARNGPNKNCEWKEKRNFQRHGEARIIL